MRTLTVCMYIMGVYWLSSRFPELHALFFPTLGAFSLLFTTSTHSKSKLFVIAFGAVLSAVIGTSLYHFIPGPISLPVNTLVTIWMIRRFSWNAPPILAVSFIPFFVRSSDVWTVPLSVFAALVGLLIVLIVVEAIEKRIPLPAAWGIFDKSGSEQRAESA